MYQRTVHRTVRCRGGWTPCWGGCWGCRRLHHPRKKVTVVAQIKMDQSYPLRRALHLHLVHPLPLHHPVDAQHATHLLITVVPPIHPPHGAEDGPERRGVETKPCKCNCYLPWKFGEFSMLVLHSISHSVRQSVSQYLLINF